MTEIKLIKTAKNIIKTVFTKYKEDEIAISFNGGKDNIVMLSLIMDVINENNYKIPICIYFKDNNEFPEITNFVNKIKIKYNLFILEFNSDIKQELNKLKDLVPSIKSIFMGIRKDDNIYDTQYFSYTDKGWPLYVRVHPLLDFNYRNIWNYIEKNNIPYCSLYDKGYTSIDNIYNTIPNPKLKYYDIKNNIYKYLSAKKLLYNIDERLGRI